MKTIRNFFLGLMVTMMFGFSSSAQVNFEVRVRPTPPVIVRPAPPSPRHVWIDEDWAWRGGQYVYIGGHWEAPPQAGWVWRPGHWRQTPHGWAWVPGHWRHR